MILYRLRCSKGHEFESWFKDSKTYERQEKKSLIGCAVCGEARVSRAPMAPRLGKGSTKVEVEKNCEHVGDKFAEEARKIHYGESDKRGIYGETSDEEAEALADEGIEFGRLPWIPRGN